jgi:hypothetical protein
MLHKAFELVGSCEHGTEQEAPKTSGKQFSGIIFNMQCSANYQTAEPESMPPVGNPHPP